eukprot:GDKJ01019984.1.p1 GENE.GDKJ01019984.1~~GDKJ01019984.1.p1  ORF type:complete len:187 (-),score=42.34 GDKJ01019984.1:13-573(-)
MFGSVIEDNSQVGQGSVFGNKFGNFNARSFKTPNTVETANDKDLLTLTLFGFPAAQWEAVKSALQRVTGPIEDAVVSWSHVRVSFSTVEAVKLCKDFNGTVVNDHIIGVSTQKPQLRSDADYQRTTNRDEVFSVSKSNNVAGAVHGVSPEIAASALKLSAQLGTPLEQSEKNSSLASSFLRLLFDI